MAATKNKNSVIYSGVNGDESGDDTLRNLLSEKVDLDGEERPEGTVAATRYV